MIEIVADFETRSKLPIVHGAWNYSRHPSTEPLILSYKINKEPIKHWTILDGFNLPSDLVAALKSSDKKRFVAHNYWFEFCIWTNVCVPKYGWPEIKENEWYDTMGQCAMHAIPLNLEEGAGVLKLLQQKSKEGKGLIKFFSIPRDSDGNFNQPQDYKAKFEQFVMYCDQDVATTDGIYDTLLDFKPTESDIYIPLSHRMNLTGIPVDVESARIILDKVETEKEGYTEKLSELTGGIITKVTQTKRMKDWLSSKFDIHVPNFTAETVQSLLDGKYGELPKDAESLVEMRATGGKSSTAKYEALIYLADDDERIRGSLIYHAARTGRLSGRGFNVPNLPKPSVKYESTSELVKDLVSMTNAEVYEKYGSFMKAASTAVRPMVKAPRGKKLYVADYAAIEARGTFWLADCEEGLALYHAKEDLYIHMAVDIYSTKYETIKDGYVNGDKEADGQRWVGKQTILGAGYGLGWKGFQNTCESYGELLPDELCQDSIHGYRNRFPEVVKLWDNLDKASMLAARNVGLITCIPNKKVYFKAVRFKNGQVFLFMKIPSGRLIAFPDMKIRQVKTPWGAVRDAITYKKKVNAAWVPVSTYGGKLTENAVQGIARDIMYRGMLNAYERGFEIFANIYDELLGCADEDFATIKEYENLLCSPMDEWAYGFPLEAEGKILDRYQKL